MEHQSLWLATAGEPSEFPFLHHDLEAEWLIIGGGITGITTAYVLHKAGVKVHLIEAEKHIGGVDTSHTTGHLSTSTDMHYYKLSKSYGEDTSRSVATAMQGAVDFIAKLAEEEQLDCDFAYQPGYLYADREEQVEELEKEFEATQKTGLDIEWAATTPLPFPIIKAIQFNNNGRFHPLKFVYGLAKKLQEAGVPIYTQTRALEMSKEDGMRVLKTNMPYKIRAKHVILATHLPAFLKPEQSALPPSRTYAMAFKVQGETPQGLFWDMHDPYHYTRNADYNGEQVLITGGCDHKTGHHKSTREHFEKLEEYVRSHFPVQEIVYRWSGQWYEPTDKLPLIGKSILHDDIYVASGYSGDGMVFGVAAAQILTDLITGQPNGIAEFFKPRRLHLKADYVKNNLDVAAHFIKDRLPLDTSKLAEIEPGEGKLVQDGLSKYAVYRDEKGNYTAMSPVCTHMGCIVHWNDAEKTWDCPCHGGQFSCMGEPLRAPVTKKLKRQPIEELKFREEK